MVPAWSTIMTSFANTLWHSIRPLVVVVVPLATGCTASAPPTARQPVLTSSALTTTDPQTSASSGATNCEVVCAGAQLITQTSEAPDHHSRAVASADRVFAAMHDDLLACYKARVLVDPNAHAFLTVDVVIGPDGRVRSVETTGGARLGNRGLDCIVNRIKAATFEPMPGGGTRRIQVPFTLRRVGVDESI